MSPVDIAIVELLVAVVVFTAAVAVAYGMQMGALRLLMHFIAMPGHLK